MPARKRSDVPRARLSALESGVEATRTLVEALAMSLPRLVTAVADDLGPAADAALAAAQSELGYAARLAAIGQAIGCETGKRGDARLQRLAKSPSDTVRGWCCYAVQVRVDGLANRLDAMRPFASDAHFGVREWAWMALRPHIVSDLPAALKALRPWTKEADPNLRRFAIEVLRPVGVWCKAIPALRENPDQAAPLLDAVAADPERYVQDSLANWMNDAARTRPDAVRARCKVWLGKHRDNLHTERIVARALRRCGW